MRVTGATIQQLDKGPDGKKPKSRCRKWRLWATTDEGRKSKRFDGAYSQAQDALKAFVAELEGVVPNSETFGSYAESWRLWRESSCGLDEQTLVNDRRNVSALSRVLGDERMDAITPEIVKSALMELKLSREGKPLSGTYMNNLFTALNNIMQTALDDGRIASNPCAKVKPPKCDTAERRALSASEMDAMWANVLPLAESGDGRAMAVLLMLDAGLRPQEALALRPEDIANGTIRVRRGMKEKSGNIGKTKRPASMRDLPMTDRLADACAAYARTRMGGPCFCENARDGGPLRMQNVRRWWDKHHVSLGAFDGMVPYELRHSNLTKMARFMSVFDLQRWAGWASIAPAKVYVHADQSALESAVKRSQIGPAVHQVGIERTKNAPENDEGQTATA